MAIDRERPEGTTPPPGVRGHVAALRLARVLALLAIVVAAVIALSSCAAGGGGPAATGDPHAGVETGAPADPDSTDAAADAHTDAADGAAPGQTVPGRAVAAGIGRAASYGFDLSQPAGQEQLEALREAPQDTLEGVVVIPSTCEAVLQDLNWSPVQLGGDAARTDFAAEKVRATGSVEVAAVGDRADLDAHYATVEKMLGECQGMNLNMQSDGPNGGVVTETVPLTSTAPAVADGAADSALLWTRGRGESALKQQALVLMKERGGHVAMVSFIATEGLEAQEFSDMAAAILDATLAELPQ